MHIRKHHHLLETDKRTSSQTQGTLSKWRAPDSPENTIRTIQIVEPVAEKTGLRYPTEAWINKSRGKRGDFPASSQRSKNENHGTKQPQLLEKATEFCRP